MNRRSECELILTRALTTLLLLLVTAGIVDAAAFDGNPRNYCELLKKLEPGDILRLRSGIYRKGLLVHRLNGTKLAPILITGPKIGAPAVFIAKRGRNTISIVDSGYVTIRDLTLDGQGLPVDGVKAEGHAAWAHHITLENLRIRGYGNNQQTVGISTKCPAWGWVIRDNEIHGTGAGVYLGNSDGSDPFVGGLIEYNLIADTIGYNLRIKHQKQRPKEIGMPTSKRMTIIRHNVFSKAHGGAEKPMARPNVLVGHWPKKGIGAEDRNVLYGNLFYQNSSEALFQGEGNITLYNNLFVNFGGDGIRIQPHNDIPRAIDVFFNTIVATGIGIAMHNKEGPLNYVQRIASNLVFTPHPIVGGSQEANTVRPLDDSPDYLINPLAAIGAMDLYPKSGALRNEQIDTEAIRGYPDWDRDFNQFKRIREYPGAYNGAGRNPGWIPKLSRKPRSLTRKE